MRQSTIRQRKYRNSYESKNDLGIPDLDPQMLMRKIPDGIDVYGRAYKRMRPRHALSFFSDDYRFESAWTYPDRMVEAIRKRNPTCVIEPDFSIWRDDPLVQQQWALFKTRWCGRHFQKNGITVIPSINWGGEESFSWCFSGIPHGAAVVACEAVTCGIFRDDFNAGLAAALDIVNPGKVLVYGGEDWILNDERIVMFSKQEVV